MQGVSSTQHAACALWGHVRLTIKGVEVGGSCLLPCPSSPPEPQARDQAAQTEEGGHSCFPTLPTPSPFFLLQALLECDRSRGQGMSRQQEHML